MKRKSGRKGRIRGVMWRKEETCRGEVEDRRWKGRKRGEKSVKDTKKGQTPKWRKGTENRK